MATASVGPSRGVVRKPPTRNFSDDHLDRGRLTGTKYWRQLSGSASQSSNASGAVPVTPGTPGSRASEERARPQQVGSRANQPQMRKQLSSSDRQGSTLSAKADRTPSASRSTASPALGPSSGSPRSPGQTLRACPSAKQSSKQLGQRAVQASSPSMVASVSCSDSDLRCAALVTVAGERVVWCGERDGALTVRDADKASVTATLPMCDRMQDYVWSLLQVGNCVWVGTSSGRLRIYDAATREILAERIKHAGGIYALAASDSCVYTGSNDFTIYEWDQATWDASGKVFTEHSNQVRCLCAFAGCLVSGGDDRCLRFWDTTTAKSKGCFQHADSVLALAYVPRDTKDGVSAPSSVWVGDDAGRLSVYDLPSPAGSSEISEPHQGSIYSLLWERGVVFSASADKTVRMWNPASRACLQVVDAHRSYVYALVPVLCDMRTRFWSFGGDKTIRTWDFSRLPASNNDQQILQLESRAKELEELSADASRKLTQQAEELVQLHDEVSNLKETSDALRRDRKESEDVWRKTERDMDDRMKEVIAKLDSCNSELRDAQSEASQATERVCVLDAQAEEMRSQLAASEASLAAADAKAESLTSELVTTTQQHDDAVTQLRQEQQKVETLQTDLQQSTHMIESLQRKLTEALAKIESMDMREQKLAEQIAERDQAKRSRLAFVSEIWGLHRETTAARKQAFAEASTNAGAAKAKFADKSQKGMSESFRAIALAQEHSTIIIKRYLTDDEKLHLGIPLETYDGGRNSSRVLAWGEDLKSSVRDDASTPDAATFDAPPSPETATRGSQAASVSAVQKPAPSEAPKTSGTPAKSSAPLRGARATAKRLPQTSSALRPQSARGLRAR